MTNGEAIVVLQKIKPIPHRGDSKSTTHTLEIIAIDMAIRALEQQPCEDCISREQAKQFLYERIDRLNDDELYDIFSRIIDDMYNELPSVQPQPRWFSVSERLPMIGDTFLVTIEYKGEVIGVDVASYSPVDGYIDKHWETFNDWKEDDDSCYHVTAWMPLPSSYQGRKI